MKYKRYMGVLYSTYCTVLPAVSLSSGWASGVAFKIADKVRPLVFDDGPVGHSLTTSHLHFRVLYSTLDTYIYCIVLGCLRQEHMRRC